MATTGLWTQPAKSRTPAILSWRQIAEAQIERQRSRLLRSGCIAGQKDRTGEWGSVRETIRNSLKWPQFMRAHMMRVKSAAFLASICLSVPLNAFALCFEPTRPCSWCAVHHGQPPLIGTVTSEETVPDAQEFGGRIVSLPVQKVTFNVEEPFEDTLDKTV